MIHKLFKTKLIYPYLIALYPVLHLISVNTNILNDWMIYLVVVVVAITVFITLAIMKIFIQDGARRALFTSVFFILFFSNDIMGNEILPFILGKSVREGVTMFSLIVLIALSFYGITKAYFQFNVITEFLNYFGFMLILIVIFTPILNGLVNKSSRKIDPINPFLLNRATIIDTTHHPDIYFIILDMHAGQQSLKEYFNYDEKDFIIELAKKGFFVSKNSHSNYNATLPSLASTLNMNYILPQDSTLKNNSLSEYLHFLIRSNAVVQYLHDHQYVFANLSIWEALNDVAEYPYVNQSEFNRSTFYSGLIFQTILNRFFGRCFFDVYAKRKDIAQRSAEIKNIITIKGPKFVYIHFLLPHPNYGFTSTGEKPPISDLLMGGKSDHNYLEQLKYSDKLALETINGIIQNSPNSVIILQGDHGYHRSPKKIDEEMLSNLNAIRLPGKDTKDLNDTLSSVNTFRIVFNTLFNDSLPILPNHHFIDDGKGTKYRVVHVN